MEKTVYGDLLFFVNFCMDFQCLFLAAKLLRRPFSIPRGALFSALGALYACAALFWHVSGGIAFFLDLAVCFLMCFGVFWQKKMRFSRLFAPFGVYFGVSFAVGGVMSGVGALLAHAGVSLGEGHGEVGTGAFFLLAAAGGLSTFMWGRFCQRRAKGKRAAFRVRLAERETTVDGMVDTANLLCDPVSGRPVVFLSESAAKTVFPPPLLRVCEEDPAAALTKLSPALARRVRLLPGVTVTGRRLVAAVRPDGAWLDAGRGEVPVQTLIAVAPAFGSEKECAALLPAALITE